MFVLLARQGTAACAGAKPVFVGFNAGFDSLIPTAVQSSEQS
jgi:hypothetical protein